MSIDKASDGVPEVHPARRTTKVNLSMIGAVVLFIALGIGGVVWFAHHHPTSAKILGG